MTDTRKARCRCCGKLYQPDPRVRWHQNYCSLPACRKASKAKAQRLWRKSKKGCDYFQGSANVLRVKAWRRKHPGYWKRKRKRKTALQDQLPPQSDAASHVTTKSAILALQDQLALQTKLLLGLIAKFAPRALQDEIAPTLNDLIVSGQRLHMQMELTVRDEALRNPAEPAIEKSRRTCRQANGEK